MDKSAHLLNALQSGDTAQISAAFNAAIREKVSTALDIRKSAVASEFYSTPPAK